MGEAKAEERRLEAEKNDLCLEVNSTRVNGDTDDENSSQDISHMTVQQLKDKLRAINLSVTGRKQELINRLNKYFLSEEQDAESRSKTALSKESRKRKVSANAGCKKKPHESIGITSPLSKTSSLSVQ